MAKRDKTVKGEALKAQKALDDRIEIPFERIKACVLAVRGVLVLLDSDLAELYGVETRTLNQAVKRNRERFPKDFMFQLTKEEYEVLWSKFEVSNLKSQTVISSSGHGGRRKPPYVFTEQGVAMLSSVLRSDRAVQVNISIMRAFVEMRRWAQSHEQLAEKITQMETKYDQSLMLVFEALKKLTTGSDDGRKIGFRKLNDGE